MDALSEGVEAVGRGEAPAAVDPRLIERLTRLLTVEAPQATETAIPERRREPRPGAALPLPARVTARQVRVDLDRLDSLVNGVGELVVARNRLSAIADREIGSELEQVTPDLRPVVAAERVCSEPAGAGQEVFDRFPRMVRDLGREWVRGRLELQGNEIEVDRSVLDALAEPVTQRSGRRRPRAGDAEVRIAAARNGKGRSGFAPSGFATRSR